MADDDWAKAVDNQEAKKDSSGLSEKVDSLHINKQASDTNQPSAAGDPGAAATAPSATAPPPPPASANTSWEEGGEDDKVPSKADSSLLNKVLRTKLVDAVSDLEVLQKDPNSPLYSIKSFESLNLRKELLDGVYGMGFLAPSKIQETALPVLLADPPQNMIAQSQSGTGKTAAFALTMLSRVDTANTYPQCLCLAPTYELALQIGEVVRKMGKYIPNLSIRFAVRGERVNRGQKLTDHILIGTPGTMLDWAIKFRVIDMKKVNVFVLDEADVMIDTQGHQDQSIRLQRELRRDCQMLLFSATYEGTVMKFAQAVISHPVVIRLRKEEESLDNIKQYYIQCRNRDDKFSALSNIYGTISIGQSMIFCHTRKTANWLCESMTREGHSVALLTGELDVSQRADVISRFRAAKEKVLITTNVSARGIDVEQVTVVVNFDLPIDQERQPDYETYLHRIGRTGRFGKNGLAINMVDSDFTMNVLSSIERHFGKKIHKLDAEDIDEIEKLEKS